MKQLNITPDFTSNPKQGIAMKYLFDSTTTELMWGGSAGGGKSFLGCAWLIICALRYPGIRLLMGRSKLKALEETTLVTFFDVCQKWGLEVDVHYKYNSKKNTISFGNDYGGSVILLKDLFSYPSDPEFDSLGSLEITAAFIDEVSQISSKAKQIVRSRIRYKLDNFCPKCAKQRIVDLDENKMWTCSCGNYTKGLLPKMFMTCNPAKNWVYSEFYKPWKDGVLADDKKFVPALVNDNKYIQSSYIDNLQGLTGTNRERLLEGNWEYDETTWSLINYDAIVSVFYNNVSGGERIITADIARQGRDKTVVGVWNGLRLEHIYSLDKNTIPEAIDFIKTIKNRNMVHIHNLYIDADGIGGAVADAFNGCVSIVNNSPPIYVDGERENFGNLKSQLYFYLAECINEKRMYIRPDEHRDKITQELEWCRQKSADHDGKFYCLPKQEIRENLGRSPDLLDMLSFRMYHELNNGELYL